MESLQKRNLIVSENSPSLKNLTLYLCPTLETDIITFYFMLVISCKRATNAHHAIEFLHHRTLSPTENLKRNGRHWITSPSATYVALRKVTIPFIGEGRR